ncbi:unnamed protein product [Caenorhabditis nigoni]
MVLSYTQEYYSMIEHKDSSGQFQPPPGLPGVPIAEAVNIFYEALVDEFLALSYRLGFDTVTLMKVLAIANYFPEIYLPLLFILDTVRVWGIVKKFLCSKNRASDRGAHLNVGNVT